MRIKIIILKIICPKSIIQVLAFCILICNCSLFAQNAIAPNNIYMRPYKQNGIFYSKSHVGFFLKLISNSSERQRGAVAIEIKNSTNGVVFHDNISIYLGSKGSFAKELDYGSLGLLAGIYTIYLNVNTNIGTTINQFSFIVDPNNAQLKNYRPADFSTFWDDTKRDLYFVNPNYQVKKRSDLSSSRADVYSVEFQSLDNVTIRGYLTIPNKRGIFPVMCIFPDYVTELKPEFISNMAVFSVNVRGVGTSKDKVKADFSQYLNLDANNRRKFIYRGVYMDCIRSVDFISKYGGTLSLDTTKIILKGVGQGAGLCAVTAALSPKVKGIIMERPLFMDVRDIIANAETNKPVYWPASAMLEYCNGKNVGMTKDMLLKNWDYFDPVNFAPYIGCAVLYGFAYRSNMTPSICHFNFLAQLRVDSKDILMCTDCENEMDNKFYGFQGTWMNEVLDIP